MAQKCSGMRNMNHIRPIWISEKLHIPQKIVAMRVLKPTGTLLFKWNQDQIPFRLVLATIAVDGYKPILGDKRSKTRWSVFIKS